VPTRRSHYLRDAAVVTCAGVAAAGAASVLGEPLLMAGSLVAGVSAGVVVGGVGWPGRRDPDDRLLEALAPQLGSVTWTVGSFGCANGRAAGQVFPDDHDSLRPGAPHTITCR
jgi:hypothetical protein